MMWFCLACTFLCIAAAAHTHSLCSSRSVRICHFFFLFQQVGLRKLRLRETHFTPTRSRLRLDDVFKALGFRIKF